MTRQNPPLVLGGQGRTAADLRSDARWLCWLGAGAVSFGFWVLAGWIVGLL